jgi:thioredoxin-dependent peroxiredoxin
MLSIGEKAPDFIARDQSDNIQKLSNYVGKWILLYFYPKDFTSGCTTEACTLRDNYEGFKKIDAVVLGVSADTVSSHADFSKTYSLPFPIISDVNKKIAQVYRAGGFLPRRVSYLINPEGKIAKVYEKVSPADHAAEVIKDLEELKK